MKNKTTTILWIITIILLAFIAIFVSTDKSSKNISWDKDSWQAIFLNNDQVYFGKVGEVNKNELRLKNVYYLQNSENTQSGSTTLNLIKLGSEFHGPADEMVITRSNILFWENLRQDSKVVKTIEYLNK